MVLHFKRWLATMKNVKGQENPLQLHCIANIKEAKQEIAKRVNLQVKQQTKPEVFDEEIEPDSISIATRQSKNNKRMRIFFLDGKSNVLAEMRRYNKEEKEDDENA